MAFLDIVAGMVKTYRQSIIFNIENDYLEVSAGLVEVYHGVLTEWLNDEEITLTPRPKKPVLAFLDSGPDVETEYKFESTYNKQIFDWIFDNLEMCEEGFGKHLYSLKQMFPVMQVAVSDYRNALLFQLQKGRKPRAAIRFTRIMNKLLSEDYQIKLDSLPSGQIFSSQKETELYEWCLQSLKQIDKAIATYVKALKFLGTT